MKAFLGEGRGRTAGLGDATQHAGDAAEHVFRLDEVVQGFDGLDGQRETLEAGLDLELLLLLCLEKDGEKVVREGGREREKLEGERHDRKASKRGGKNERWGQDV